MSTITPFPDASNPRQMVAAEIRALLGRRGMSQSQLSQVIGISQPQLSKRLKGLIPFDLDELVLLADYFGVSVGSLFGEMTNTPRPGGPGGGGRYAIRDSNPEPADLEQFRNRRSSATATAA